MNKKIILDINYLKLIVSEFEELEKHKNSIEHKLIIGFKNNVELNIIR